MFFFSFTPLFYQNVALTGEEAGLPSEVPTESRERSMEGSERRLQQI